MDLKRSVLFVILLFQLEISGVMMVQREARCYSTGLDLFNVGCTFIGLEYIIALKNVTFGYSNHTSDECEATDGTIEGCEEPMSETQLKDLIGMMSAQQLLNGYRFPPTTPPDFCSGFGKIPTYMAFYYECIQQSSVLKLCEEGQISGQRVSVQNDAYPINTQPSRYHKCACAVNTHGSRMTIKTLHSQLNCTNHDQNLTLVSENQTVYSWQCNKFMFNEVHEYSGEETMLLTWNGELGSTSGKFWVDFQGNSLDISLHCYPVPDPTSPGPSTLAITTEVPKTAAELTKDVSPISGDITTISNTNNTRMSSSDQPSSTSSRRQFPINYVYIVASCGALVLIVIVATVVIALRRRSKPEVIDMQLQERGGNSTSPKKKPPPYRSSSRKALVA